MGPVELSVADQLMCAAQEVRHALELRDGLIARRAGEGASLRQVAREAHLSHTAVAKIVRRRQGELGVAAQLPAAGRKVSRKRKRSAWKMG